MAVDTNLHQRSAWWPALRGPDARSGQGIRAPRAWPNRTSAVGGLCRPGGRFRMTRPTGAAVTERAAQPRSVRAEHLARPTRGSLMLEIALAIASDAYSM